MISGWKTLNRDSNLHLTAMNRPKKLPLGAFFGRMDKDIAKLSGSTAAFITAASIVIVLGITGPLSQYSETWQLVIYTGTSIIAFLMVFLLQRAQNKDSLVLHLKLNELRPLRGQQPPHQCPRFFER